MDPYRVKGEIALDDKKTESVYEKRARERAEKEEARRAELKAKSEANDMLYWDLQDQHGVENIDRIIFGGVDMVVIKRPDATEYKRMKETVERKVKKDGKDIETLAYKCIISPSGPSLDALLTKHPGAIGAISSAVLTMAGALNEAEGKG